MAVEEAPHCAGRERRAVLDAQQIGQLDQANVLLRLDRIQDHVAQSLNAMRARVTTLGLGLDRAYRVQGLHPAHGAGSRNTKPFSSGPAGQTARYRRHQSGPKIYGKWLAHACWPPGQPA